MQNNNYFKQPQMSNNTGVEQNEQHVNKDQNFDPQMSQNKRKCWCFKYCLYF